MDYTCTSPSRMALVNVYYGYTKRFFKKLKNTLLYTLEFSAQGEINSHAWHVAIRVKIETVKMKTNTKMY